jgi:hypothetical protein
MIKAHWCHRSGEVINVQSEELMTSAIIACVLAMLGLSVELLSKRRADMRSRQFFWDNTRTIRELTTIAGNIGLLIGVLIDGLLGLLVFLLSFVVYNILIILRLRRFDIGFGLKKSKTVACCLFIVSASLLLFVIFTL